MMERPSAGSSSYVSMPSRELIQQGDSQRGPREKGCWLGSLSPSPYLVRGVLPISNPTVLRGWVEKDRHANGGRGWRADGAKCVVSKDDSFLRGLWWGKLS